MVINKFWNLFLLAALFVSWSCSDTVKKMDKTFEGQFSINNKRVGKWNYYNDRGDLIASGSYSNGLKKGTWVYSQKTYNGSNTIEWIIFSNEIFKLNIPNDWKFKTNIHKSMPLSFSYNTPSQPNGNITLIRKDSLLSLHDASNILINQNDIGDSHEILLQKEIEINGFSSIYTQQVISINGKEVFIEQYLIEGVKENYLVSFFVKKKDITVYHQLFAEIAYSFTKDSI